MWSYAKECEYSELFCYVLNYLSVHLRASIYWASAFCKTHGWALSNIKLWGSNIATVKYSNYTMQSDACYMKLMDILVSYLVSSTFCKCFVNQQHIYIQANSYFLKAGVRGRIHSSNKSHVIRGIKSLARILVTIPRYLCLLCRRIFAFNTDRSKKSAALASHITIVFQHPD